MLQILLKTMKKTKHLAFSQRSDTERLQQTEQVFFLSCVFLTAAAVACTHAQTRMQKKKPTLMTLVPTSITDETLQQQKSARRLRKGWPSQHNHPLAAM